MAIGLGRGAGQAMENATKNCGEMITKLTLQMNKVGAPPARP